VLPPAVLAPGLQASNPDGLIQPGGTQVKTPVTPVVNPANPTLQFHTPTPPPATPVPPTVTRMYDGFTVELSGPVNDPEVFTPADPGEQAIFGPDLTVQTTGLHGPLPPDPIAGHFGQIIQANADLENNGLIIARASEGRPAELTMVNNNSILLNAANGVMEADGLGAVLTIGADEPPAATPLTTTARGPTAQFHNPPPPPATPVDPAIFQNDGAIISQHQGTVILEDAVEGEGLIEISHGGTVSAMNEIGEGQLVEITSGMLHFGLVGEEAPITLPATISQADPTAKPTLVASSHSHTPQTGGQAGVVAQHNPPVVTPPPAQTPNGESWGMHFLGHVDLEHAARIVVDGAWTNDTDTHTINLQSVVGGFVLSAYEGTEQVLEMGIVGDEPHGYGQFRLTGEGGAMVIDYSTNGLFPDIGQPMV